MPKIARLRRTIGEIPVRELADLYGTPTYVYDASIIVQRLADLKRFDYVRYAQKACSNPSILQLVRRRGALVDTVSAGEMQRALASGFVSEGDPPPIVYTADIFDQAALATCVDKNIHVNCGSIDMIRQFGKRARGREITLRINPGFGRGHSRKTNAGGPQAKHGVWHEQLSEAMSVAAEYELTVVGLHMHIGSGADLEHLAKVCDALEKGAHVAGPTIRSISVGGGLPIPYRPGEAYVDLDAYFELCDAARKRLEKKFGHAVTLEIEPGRYIVAESGYLIAEIRAVKRQDDNRFYLLDAGFTDLVRPAMYGAYHPMSVAAGAGDDLERPLHAVIVGGPLCEPGDIFTQEEGGYVSPRDLPEAQVGDYVVIECAGAYGAVMGSNYNSRMLAAEVLVHGGRHDLIRRRQTYEDLASLEIIVDTDDC